MLYLSAGEARRNFADSLNRVAFGGERIVLTRRGKTVAAIVPIDDLHILEQLEDKIDVEDAKKATIENESVTWEQVKEEAGIE